MKSDKAVKDHQEHHDGLQAAVDWLTLMKDRLSTCADTSGDRHTLQNKLDRVKVHEIAFLMPRHWKIGGILFYQCPSVCPELNIKT